MHIGTFAYTILYFPHFRNLTINNKNYFNETMITYCAYELEILDNINNFQDNLKKNLLPNDLTINISVLQ